ncbi:MAG: metal-dependent transcriptional regulator [Armatimonadetes bacterium]|nr:metal-dependent transcriptional regulator [Armatimonadota bacterium]
MPKANFASEAVENYLKAIYQICQGTEGAPVQDIAEQLGVSAPGVSKMLRHLAAHQLVRYTPYQPVHLTDLGEKIALETIRHHRLLELYLMESLGYGWEQVHSEAERLEHHISEEFEASIERLLGFPSFDPHGDPIPTRDGRMPPPVMVTLGAQEDGARLVVRRVTDEDGDLLRYLGERGLRPGTAVVILDREPFGGSLRLQVADREQRISPEAARHVFIERLAPAPAPPERTTEC